MVVLKAGRVSHLNPKVSRACQFPRFCTAVIYPRPPRKGVSSQALCPPLPSRFPEADAVEHPQWISFPEVTRAVIGAGGDKQRADRVAHPYCGALPARPNWCGRCTTHCTPPRTRCWKSAGDQGGPAQASCGRLAAEMRCRNVFCAKSLSNRASKTIFYLPRNFAPLGGRRGIWQSLVTMTEYFKVGENEGWFGWALS